MEPGDAGTKLEKSDDLLALGQRPFSHSAQAGQREHAVLGLSL